MSTATPHIRAVLDARYDIDGTEDINASSLLGWTTHLVNFYTGFGFPATQAYTFGYSLFIDSNGDFPSQDGVLVLGNPPGAFVFLNPTVGLKHYQHQMQAMKGYSGGGSSNMAGDFDSNSPSSNAGSVEAVYNGSGTYKSVDISMGEMRGLRYHNSYNGVWPSSGGSEEHLPNTGEISVGNTAV